MLAVRRTLLEENTTIRTLQALFDRAMTPFRVQLRGCIDPVDRYEPVLAVCTMPLLFYPELDPHTRRFIKLGRITFRTVAF